MNPKRLTWKALLPLMVTEIRAVAPTCPEDLLELAERLSREVVYVDAWGQAYERLEGPDDWHEELCEQATSKGLWAPIDHDPEFKANGYDNPPASYGSGRDYWQNEAGEVCYG
jgi:hypothetical protein